jgi:hypothetical protein
VSNARFLVAADLIRGKKLVAAAVVYDSAVTEPSFAYTLHGRSRVGYLYRRGDRIPPVLDTALNEHIRDTAVSWSLVTAHAQCPPEAALGLAVIRAVERWVCRQTILPNLSEIEIILPTKKPLVDLPALLKQITHTKDWHTAAARALCRYRSVRE